MGARIREIPAKLPKNFDRPDEPWYHHLTIDLIWKVLGYTVFHPWVAWVIVLCLRAQVTPYQSLEMQIAIVWAFLTTGRAIFGIINAKLAYGNAREVDLSEEVIVITGGVGGLGALIAEVYGMRNANVAVLDTKKVDLEEAEEKGVVYYECDVGDAQQVDEAVKEIVEDLGPPTILINNAGIVHTQSILDSTAEEVRQTFRTNTFSHFNTLRSCLPHMLNEGRGTIVTVSSVLGHLGAANLSSYTSSKAALLALHSSLRAELAQHPNGEDIKTILVTPGQMSTKMFAGVRTPSNFLAPVIAPVDIAKEVIGLIEKGESGDVAVPLYSRYIQILGVLPLGVQVLIRKWSGIDTAMAKAGLMKADKTALNEKR
ncbi:short chain dehydrogenase/reductase [Lindgomyces ingoldianus]|uniref:Short chain dehydrogenase/reductase n=1 Tax=Lindgomyces ingoldianus TaxID=673940 RepID=A0ACB6QEV4_9PLEO|nr:short chain dehydrogenase/reductase [Lindgomyces ingoldianus]KAF2465451.1 short chain dehydrogenase/reductase [Lindgomyces ingoldianus]